MITRHTHAQSATHPLISVIWSCLSTLTYAIHLYITFQPISWQLETTPAPITTISIKPGLFEKVLIFRHKIAWNLRPSMQITIIRVFINYCNKPPPTSSKPIVPHCTTTAIFIQVQTKNRSCRTKWLVCLISPNVYICPLLSRPTSTTIQLN